MNSKLRNRYPTNLKDQQATRVSGTRKYITTNIKRKNKLK